MTEPRASRSTDARALRSRAALREALLSLIEEKDFQQIPVREIATRAGVTFPTFYRQFATKEDLLADIARDELARLAARMSLRRDRDNAEITARSICEYVGQHRALWAVLLGTGAAAVMRDEFVKLTEEWAGVEDRINPELPADMVASFVIASMFEILGWWLRQPADYSAERIARYLELLVLAPASSHHVLTSPAR